MSNRLIKLSTEFTRYPGGRYKKDGPFSGEQFREEFLIPKLADALRDQEKLVVALEGVAGYASSFLEEAFGGLVRSRQFDPHAVTSSIVVESGDPLYDSYRDLAIKYMHDEAKRPAHAH